MSVSSSDNFNQTRDQLLSDALDTIGVDVNMVSATKLTTCQNIMNKLIHHMQTKMHTWSEVEGTVFLTAGINKYTLSATTTNSAGNDTVKTTLSAAGSSTTLVCTKVTGMSISDNIGIVLDSGDMQFTTITNINTTTKTLTINTSLSSAASSGAVIYVYTQTCSRPLNISNARLCNSSNNERIVSLIGRDMFMQLSSKDTEGSPTQGFYQQGRDTGTLYLRPTPSSSSESINISYSRSLFDFDVGADNPDVPQEWLLALTLQLSVQLAPVFGKNLQKDMPLLPAMAERALTEAMLADVNAGSVHLVPNSRDS